MIRTVTELCWPACSKEGESWGKAFQQGCGFAFGRFGVRDLLAALENTGLEDSIQRLAASTSG